MKTLYIQAIFWMLVWSFMGCGEDSSNTATSDSASPTSESPSNDGLGFTGESIQSTWKIQCIDNNLVHTEANYQNCLNIYTNPALTPQCLIDKNLNTSLLASTWDLIAKTAMANYHQCLTDPRMTPKYCQGSYESEIAFQVGLKCEEFATKYF